MTFKITKKYTLELSIPILLLFSTFFQFSVYENQNFTPNCDDSELEVISNNECTSTQYQINEDKKIVQNKNIDDSTQWTIMAVINSEAPWGEHAGLDCLQELEAGLTLGAGVEIVTLVDRIPGYDSANGDWSNSRYYHVTPDNDTRVIGSEVVQDFTELNLGNPQTYRDFVIWAQTNYPAENYLLTYIGHGGAVSGFSFDDTDGDHLTLNEFQQAMSGLYVDIVALDSCKMGMLEVAYECRTFTDYIVLSEQYAVTEGFDYKAFTEELCDNSSLEPYELADTIARTCLEWYPWKYDHTRSVVNCTALNPLIAKISELSSELDKLLPSEITRISDLRLRSYELDRTFLDLGSFLTVLYVNYTDNLVIRNLTKSVIDIYNDIVVSNYVGFYAQEATGLVIFFPQDTNALTSIFDLSTYMNPTGFLDFDNLDFLEDCTWNAFLDNYLDNAPVIDELFVPTTSIDLETNIDVEINSENPVRKYELVITTPGVFHFSLDIETGDPSLYVSKSSSSGNPLGHFGYLFSDTQNPEQDTSEDIVHWLEVGSYVVEIYSWTENSEGSLYVEREPIQDIVLDRIEKGDFPPRRAATPPMKTIFNYFMVSLDADVYDLVLDISDNGLLLFKIWDENRTILLEEFYGNEGEDFVYSLAIEDSERYLIEFGCYEWTGSYRLGITKPIDPVVSIKSPNNVIYSDIITLNYSVTKGSISIFIDGIVNNSVIPSGTIITDLINGPHNITIIAIDIMDRKGIDSVLFTIESKPNSTELPFISLMGCLSILYLDRKIRKKR